MGSQSSAILHSERDHDVLSAVHRCDGLAGGSAGIELLVLRLLCCVTSKFRDLLENRISIHRGDDPINDKVAAVCEKSSATTSPGLQRSVAWDAGILKASLDDVH